MGEGGRDDEPRSTGIFVDQLFDEETFTKIRDLVVNVCRNVRANYDPDFVRYSLHNFGPLADVHEQIVPYASELFGEQLKRSYCFLSMYLPGGRVPMHSDRPTCYRTIDLMVQQDSDEPWPLWVSEPWTDDQWEEYDGPLVAPEAFGGLDGPVQPELMSKVWDEVVLEPNQAYCYSGTHSWHLRPTLARGRTDLIFFHFVQEEYDGILD